MLPTSEACHEQMRSVQQRRRATEAPGDRAARLQDLRARQQERIDSETPEETAAHLHDLRARQQERIDSETPEETAARLHDLRARQQERIDSETPEETAARHQRDREAHSHRPPPASAQPLLHQPAVQVRTKKFHSQLASLEVSTCTTCLEWFPGRHTANGTECTRCHRGPKANSREKNMHPGPVPMELVVSSCSDFLSHQFSSHLQGLTQVEEMLISAVMPMMSVYRLPQGQYGYSGHVINLPQDVASFAQSLPRLPSELDVIVVRKEVANQSHRDFRVRRAVVLRALKWLVAHNQYYHSMGVTIDTTALDQLPQDGNISQLVSVTEDATTDSPSTSGTAAAEDDLCDLPQSFVPVAAPSMTEQETVQQSVQHRQPTLMWPSIGGMPLNEFTTEGYSPPPSSPLELETSST